VDMEAKRQYRVLLVAIWLAFLSRGLFYSVQQPMWEGYDEWAHFAFIQHIAELDDDTSLSEQRPLLCVAASYFACPDLSFSPDFKWRSH